MMDPTQTLKNTEQSALQQEVSSENGQTKIKQQPQADQLTQQPLIDWDIQLESSEEPQLKQENKQLGQNKHQQQQQQILSQNNSEKSIANLPNFEEIQKSINILVKIMPEMFTQEVVNAFYQQLFTKLALNLPGTTFNSFAPFSNTFVGLGSQPSKSQVNYHSQIKKQPSDFAQSDKLSQQSNGSAGQGSLSPALKRQNQAKIDKGALQKKIIVNAFCSGLGYQGIQPEIRRESYLLSITEERFLQVMRQTILEAYNYVKKLAGRRYKPIAKAKPTDLLRVLNNCRKTLTPFVCQIFLKVLRQISQKNIDISVDQALRLLQGIDLGLLKSHLQPNNQKGPREIRNEKYWKQKQKLIRKEQSQGGGFKQMKFELHTRWTNDFETLLLRMYREGAGFAQIRDRFQEEYPGQSEMFSVLAIRSMFFKIMRMAVRRLTRQVWKSGRKDLPPLVKMQDQLVKNIINCSQCLNLRKLLVDVYQCETACSRQLLGKVICMINLYYENGGGFKKSQNKERDIDI